MTNIVKYKQTIFSQYLKMYLFSFIRHFSYSRVANNFNYPYIQIKIIYMYHATFPLSRLAARFKSRLKRRVIVVIASKLTRS